MQQLTKNNIKPIVKPDLGFGYLEKLMERPVHPSVCVFKFKLNYIIQQDDDVQHSSKFVPD